MVAATPVSNRPPPQSIWFCFCGHPFSNHTDADSLTYPCLRCECPDYDHADSPEPDTQGDPPMGKT
jgi:hypothetical protein